MKASSLRQAFAARLFGYGVLAAAIVLSVGGCGGKSPTQSATTTVPATTTTTSTTTSVPATTTTMASTTTITAELDARISVQNTPCVAPSSGPVSCTFAGSATGGRTPYTFRWRFTNPANNQVVTVNGQNARPELGCGFSTGVVTFNLQVQLTVTPSSGSSNTDTRTQQVARQAGACGT
jgi:hypothetical protein